MDAEAYARIVEACFPHLRVRHTAVVSEGGDSVIDWGRAMIGDPALDFVGLLAGCGAEFGERALASYTGR